jgi:hypothetical protein
MPWRQTQTTIDFELDTKLGCAVARKVLSQKPREERRMRNREREGERGRERERAREREREDGNIEG